MQSNTPIVIICCSTSVSTMSKVFFLMFNINLPRNRGWWLCGWEPLFEWNWSEFCAGRGDNWEVADPCLLDNTILRNAVKVSYNKSGTGKPPLVPFCSQQQDKGIAGVSCLHSVLLRADTEAAQQEMSTHPES